MVRQTASGHFLAALGIEHRMEQAVRAHLLHFQHKLLQEYHKEIRYERARLMRRSPMDYRAVRALDRELEEITTLLRESELERSMRK